MRALINRMLHFFVEDTYGRQTWAAIVRTAGLGAEEFDALLRHDEELTDRLVAGTETVLGRPVETVLEDVGTYLVSHENAQPVRRLLRFCGADFEDFLHSLEDLPDRIALVLPELRLPRIEVIGCGPGRYDLRCAGHPRYFACLMAGMVRAMADDYGVLAVIELVCPDDRLVVTIVEEDFAAGKHFTLGATGTGAS